MLLIAVFVLFIGCFCIAILLKTKWPGWLGVPLILVVLSAIRDLGLTPIAGLFFERYWINPMVGVAGRGEIIPASILILLNVTAITFGMILANCLKGNASPHNKNLTMQTYHSKRVYSRAWNASSLLFVLGIFCHTIVLFYLLREMNFIDIARTRALYSAKQATITPMYSYARLISSVTMIGAWGMLLFSGKKKRQMIFSIFAIITVLILEVMFGGRLKVVINVIGIAFIYHYGVKNIRIRQAIVFVMTILMGFLIIHFSRMGVANLPAGVQALTVDILMSTSVDETAFALRHFPEDVPFMGIGIMSGGLSHLVPTIGRYMNWNKNIWSVIVEYLRGGKRGYSGIGGEHYVQTAESYMQFGTPGVVWLGLIFGIFYGFIFSWQKRHQNNLFYLFSQPMLISVFLRH